MHDCVSLKLWQPKWMEWLQRRTNASAVEKTTPCQDWNNNSKRMKKYGKIPHWILTNSVDTCAPHRTCAKRIGHRMHSIRTEKWLCECQNREWFDSNGKDTQISCAKYLKSTMHANGYCHCNGVQDAQQLLPLPEIQAKESGNCNGRDYCIYFTNTWKYAVT